MLDFFRGARNDGEPEHDERRNGLSVLEGTTQWSVPEATMQRVRTAGGGNLSPCTRTSGRSSCYSYTVGNTQPDNNLFLLARRVLRHRQAAPFLADGESSTRPCVKNPAGVFAVMYCR